jgi:hypothetical protein
LNVFRSGASGLGTNSSISSYPVLKSEAIASGPFGIAEGIEDDVDDDDGEGGCGKGIWALPGLGMGPGRGGVKKVSTTEKVLFVRCC